MVRSGSAVDHSTSGSESMMLARRPRVKRHAGNIAADDALKQARITITLNRLRVADYPGGGTHQVLFDFYARHAADDDALARARDEHQALADLLRSSRRNEGVPADLTARFDWPARP